MKHDDPIDLEPATGGLPPVLSPWYVRLVVGSTGLVFAGGILHGLATRGLESLLRPVPLLIAVGLGVSLWGLWSGLRREALAHRYRRETRILPDSDTQDGARALHVADIQDRIEAMRKRGRSLLIRGLLFSGLLLGLGTYFFVETSGSWTSLMAPAITALIPLGWFDAVRNLRHAIERERAKLTDPTFSGQQRLDGS